jgi:hypothetical protein
MTSGLIKKQSISSGVSKKESSINDNQKFEHQRRQSTSVLGFTKFAPQANMFGSVIKSQSKRKIVTPVTSKPT